MKTMIYTIIALVVIINTTASAQDVQGIYKYEDFNFLVKEEGIIISDKTAAILLLDEWVVFTSGDDPDCFWVQNEFRIEYAYKIYKDNKVEIFDTVTKQFVPTDFLFITPPSRVEIYQLRLENNDVHKIDKDLLKELPLGKINDQVSLVKKRSWGMPYVFYVQVDKQRAVTIYLRKRGIEIRTGFLPTLNPETREKATNIWLNAFKEKE